MIDTALLPPNLTRRQLRRARREHVNLRAEYTKVSWWAGLGGKADYYTVRCSCGWVHDERIEIYGPLLTSLRINYAMNDHLEATCGQRSER